MSKEQKLSFVQHYILTLIDLQNTDTHSHANLTIISSENLEQQEEKNLVMSVKGMRKVKKSKQ